MRKLLASLILLVMVINILPAVSSLSDGVSVEYIPPAFNLGVGYISPSSKLDVNGTLATRGFTLNGNTVSIPSLTQGDILFAKVAGTLNRLAKGTNHYGLKVNGNKLAWESVTPSGTGVTDINGLSDAIADSDSVYLGNGAGLSDSGTLYNTAIGTDALRRITSGHHDVGIGYESLTANTTGYNNTGIGFRTLFDNTNGLNNTAIGGRSLENNLGGQFTSALGYLSLYLLNTATRCAAAGSHSGEGTSSYSFSNGTFLGTDTGVSMTIGFNNLVAGYRAGYSLTNGNGNILLGYNASDQIVTPAKNIIIGNDIDAPSSTSFYQLDIGDVIYGSASSGNVGFGTSSPSKRLDVESSAASDGIDINNTATDGDPRIAFQLSGTSTFTMGLDDGDNDKFKIGTSAIDTSTRLTIDSTGNIGIGSTAPGAVLEVTSVMLSTPTDSPGTCGAATTGGLYFDLSMLEPCFCNGTTWRQFDGGGTC